MINKKSNEGVTITMKVFDKPSDYGINGGRITKLEAKRGDKKIALYDREWILKPTDEDMNLIEEFIKNVN